MLSELLPNYCSYINTPRLTGRGGGLLTIFNKNLNIGALPSDVYNSFELQLFRMNSANPLAVALIYRPPKSNKNFMDEFADFLGTIVPKHDRLLLLGDFNIHVCCDSNPLAKDFLSLVHSFDFKQVVTVPTHANGHILELVLCCGLSVNDTVVYDTNFSDHKPVLLIFLFLWRHVFHCQRYASFVD